MSRLILFFALISSLLFLNYYANPPDGYTGAPLSDEYSCLLCHQIDKNSPTGYSQINGFPSRIIPGKKYDLNIEVNSTDEKGKYANFQLMIVDNDKSTGTLIEPKDYVKFSKYKNREYVECKPAVKIKNGKSSFNFSWIAPSEGDNKLISLYLSTIIANGDASFAGDRVIESKVIGVIGNSLDVSIVKQENNLCPNDSSAYVKVNVEGGQKPYSYRWSTGATTDEIQNLKYGNYYLTVTDKNNLIGVANVIISEPFDLKITSLEKKDITYENKGSIKIAVEGGSGEYSYKWIKDGVVFSTDKNIIDISAGCYQLNIKDTSCDIQLDSTICISDYSSTIENNDKSEVVVFPNPASTYLNIKSNISEEANIQIFDISGKVLLTQKTVSNSQEIDISILKSGVYFLKINGKNISRIEKLTIIK